MILASGSPRRKAILEQLGIPFTVQVPEVEELSAGDPAQVARANARRKATAVAGSPAGAQAVVLGVDTLVALEGRIYGKPGSEAQARAFLGALSGRTHEVWSGIAVVTPGERPREAVARTAVSFRSLSAWELDWYLASGEWRERAGGYAVQGRGAALVRRIEGDYLNVVGLPVAALLDLVPGILQASRKS